MSLASYVRGAVDMETTLEVSACSGVVLTVEQRGTQFSLTEYTETEDFGVFRFAISAENAAKLLPGVCAVQLRGFVTSNDKTQEFYTAPVKLVVDKILLEQVLTTAEEVSAAAYKVTAEVESMRYIKGDKGDKGDTGKSAYEAAQEGGYTGTEEEFNADLRTVSEKQDVIEDLETIRSGAAAGETALQEVPDTYRTSAAQDEIDKTFALKTEAGNSLELSMDSSTFVLTATLKDKDGNALSAQTVDLPLETMVVSASYDKDTKEIVLTLQSGQTVRFSVADLVSGLVSDTTFNAHAEDTVKHITAEERSKWNGKQDALTDTDKKAIADLHKDAVESVNGKTGAVELTSTDIKHTEGETETTVGAEIDALNEELADVEQLKPADAPSAVGKVLKVLSVNEDGTFTCEWAGGVTDVTVNGVSIVNSGIAAIPVITTSAERQGFGLCKFFADSKFYNCFAVASSGNLIPADKSYTLSMYSRSTYLSSFFVTFGNADTVLRYTMTDGKGAAWSDSEKTGAWKRLNAIKTSMGSVAVAGAQYYLGEQTAVSISLPTSASVGQEITVVFYSTATAATLTIEGTLLDDIPTISANQRTELNFQWDGIFWQLLASQIALTSYEITATVTNATAASTNPATIADGLTATLVYTFDGTSYTAPTDAPTVTGATGTWTRDSDTQGTLVLSAATGAVSFTIAGVAV